MRRVFPTTLLALLASGAAVAQSDKDGGDDGHFAFHFFGGGRLGVEAVQISKEVRKLLGASEDAGVLVNSVQSDSVAAEAGIKPGDVIVEVAGQKVKSVGSIRRALADKDAGQTVAVTLIRDKRSTTVNAKLRERKEPDFKSMMIDMPDGEGFLSRIEAVARGPVAATTSTGQQYTGPSRRYEVEQSTVSRGYRCPA